MTTRLRPRNDQVVVKCEPLQEELRNGLIILPHQQRVRHVEVVAVGPGYTREKVRGYIPLFVKVGDRVAFFRENMETLNGKQISHSLYDISVQYGADVALLPESAILAVIDKDTVMDA